MQGQIVFYNEEKKAGAIVADDGQRLLFYAEDWQDVVPPERGMIVTFEIDAQNRPRRVQLALAEPRRPEPAAAPAPQLRQFAEPRRPASPAAARTQQFQREDESTASLWNPMAVLLWSLLFTAIFGAWLCAKNWRALGNEEKAKKSMYWAYAGIAIYVIVMFIPADQPARMLGMVYFFVWAALSSMWRQIKYVKEKLHNAYVKRKWGKPIGIAVATMSAVIAVAFIVVLVSGEVDLSEADTTSKHIDRPSPPPQRTGEFRLEKGIWSMSEYHKVQYIKLLSMSDGQETIRNITINRGGCHIPKTHTYSSVGGPEIPVFPKKLKYGESADFFLADGETCNILEVVVDADSGSYKFTFDP